MLNNVITNEWRPQKFSEVVEQKHVCITLKNAIERNQIGQAYLFSGPRGVGKTTIARILTKTLNCLQLNKENQDACNNCENCKEVVLGNSFDYQEIDGASNRGIDHIRQLNENVYYASPKNCYRVFVIDEVHMLTIEAFNATLKTLEEPPEKVVFVFCTTEVQKVPLTIRSRCQHFAFRAFSNQQIVEQLGKILVSKKINTVPEALFEIAKSSTGSMRDAQNILEQIITYSEGDLTLDQTITVLGKTSQQTKITFVQNLYKQKLSENKLILNNLIYEGNDISSFLYELIDLLNNFVYIKAKATSEVLNLTESTYEEFGKLTNEFKTQELFLILDIIFEFIKELKSTSQTDIVGNLFLIKIHRYQNLIAEEDLKKEILNAKENLKLEPMNEEFGKHF